jgi:hypothetical protein
MVDRDGMQATRKEACMLYLDLSRFTERLLSTNAIQLCTSQDYLKLYHENDSMVNVHPPRLTGGCPIRTK